VPAIASEPTRAVSVDTPAGAPGNGRPRRRVRMSLRLRLTLLYGACFLAAGVLLLAVTYGLVANTTSVSTGAFVTKQGTVTADAGALPAVPLPLPAGRALYLSRAAPGPKVGGVPNSISVQIQQAYGQQLRKVDSATIQRITTADRKRVVIVARQAKAALTRQRNQQLTALLTRSGLALVIMAFLSVALGWVVAGRALRPLRTMNARARRITENSLHERLAVEPSHDELGELARTFDGLLGRLQRAFESQRRFVANASHELRTPVTLERALVEVALADPDASVQSLRECCERVRVAGEQQERLIEALLTLARSQGGVDACDLVDLRALVGELVRQHQGDTATVTIEATLGPAAAKGDGALIERLAANLIDNALAYNVASGGWVRVWTGTQGGRPTLRVANSGRVVPEERLEEIFEPFRCLDGERLGGSRGVGLGLSIVAAIATAHQATLDVRPVTEGGLRIEVRFPAPDGAPATESAVAVQLQPA
jgi:signal transduction histidine kinase